METSDSVERAVQRDAIRLRGRRNGGLLVGLGALAIVGSWWLVPRSIVVTLTAADPTVDLVNLVVGVIALAAGITLVMVGIQVQKRARACDEQSNAGQANPLFDNPGAPTPDGQPPLNWTGITVR